MKWTHPKKVTLVLATILASLVVLIVVAMVAPPCWGSPSQEARRGATRCSIANICTAVADFDALQHRLPNTLDELTVGTSNHPALLNNENLNDSWGRPFRYKRISDLKFEVRSVGPDGQMGIKDDLFAP